MDLVWKKRCAAQVFALALVPAMGAAAAETPAEELERLRKEQQQIEQSIEDAQDEDAAMIAVRIDTLADAEVFADCQYAIKCPLAVVSDDVAALEAALRAYQGRALYSGSLGDDVLVPMAEKYGLVL